ncbi:MAG: hypothetical protein M4579_000236 [Chaenotheca gracillima]|nr:MAG: hypothetical protein M4579_000236 [Chaenotheca gracillima]
MRSFKSIHLALVALLVCFSMATEHERADVLRRQDSDSAQSSEPPPPASTAAASSSPSPPPSITQSSAPSTSGAASSSRMSSAASSRSSASGSSATDSSASSSAAASSVTSAASSSAPPSSAAVSSAPTASSTVLPGNVTAQLPPDMLPIEPAITPGLSVAGVILMITGVVFTLIGMKDRRLHIALSSGYLASLAVTVLIIYVMHPPVSNAIQGAYVTAAVITGLIFGALSIIFPEVTEGLGCLLGGFCLSMWFLVLKPGGLIESTGPKAIFIACFSIVGFAFSFSHYTRNYALIVAISFAGATAVVLGIDCFSRAGLKEFWVYIWDLNSNLLPLGTTTFPHTRGIRVEIACNILLFLLGIVSQMKLWRMIRDRRERKKVERENDERHLAEMDDDAGRRVEHDNHRDRAQWEVVYGNKDEWNGKTDSSVTSDSLRKDSQTVVERGEMGRSGVDNIEMSEFASSKRTSRTEIESKRNSKDRNGNVITIRVARDDDEVSRKHDSVISTSKVTQSTSQPTSPRDAAFEDDASIKRNPSAKTVVPDGVKLKRSSDRSAVPPPPEVVPLPFKTPTQQEEQRDDDRSSIATFADSEHMPHRRSKRFSGGSIMRRLSARTARSSRAFSDSEEALVVPHAADDDRASSLAATVDDLTDDDSRSDFSGASFARSHHEATGDDGTRIITLDQVGPIVQQSTSDRKSVLLGDQGEAGDSASRPTSTVDIGAVSFPEPPKSNPLDASQETTSPISLTSSTDPKPQGLDSSETQTPKPDQVAKRSDSKVKPSKSVKSATQSEKSGRESVVSLTEHLPERLSKAAMSYRTNEWAKHLDRAEQPHLDEIELANQANAMQKGNATEPAAPVDVVQLQQTPADAQQPPLPRSSSQKSYQNLNQVQSPLSQLARNASKMLPRDSQSGVPGRSKSSRSIYQQAGSPYNSSRDSLNDGSSPSLSRSSSMNHLPVPQNLNPRGYRSSSTPLSSQILLENPSETSLDSRLATPSPILSPNTLIGKRDSMIRNKYSSLTVNQLPPTPEDGPSVSPNESVSALGDRVSTLDEDDMSLADRKELIQQQRQQTSNWPLSSQNQLFDAHSPKRESNHVDPERRETMLAQWRQSVRQDLSKNTEPQLAAEGRRSQMLNDRQRLLQNQRQSALASSRRDSLFDEKMRRGEMHDLHKEAMRRMQASANKHV